MKFFKKKEPVRKQYTDYLTGDVRFVSGRHILEGTIFGKPYKPNPFGPYYYNIVVGQRVHKISSNDIEKK